MLNVLHLVATNDSQALYDAIKVVYHEEGDREGMLRAMFTKPAYFDTTAWKSPFVEQQLRTLDIFHDSWGYFYKAAKIMTHVVATFGTCYTTIPPYTPDRRFNNPVHPRLFGVPAPEPVPPPPNELQMEDHPPPRVRRVAVTETVVPEAPLPRLEFTLDCDADGHFFQRFDFELRACGEGTIVGTPDCDELLDYGTTALNETGEQDLVACDRQPRELDEETIDFECVRYFHEDGRVFYLEDGSCVSPAEIVELVDAIRNDDDEAWLEE